MRLLHVTTLAFGEFHADGIPPYVATSHRWIAGTEAMIKDVRKGRNTGTLGYQKVVAFAAFVRVHIPTIEWLWIDTCCINQDSANEVSEAVNSMFRWYLNAQVCLAYLVDVQNADSAEEFAGSVWFRRGWTLQELLASRYVIFLTNRWETIGCKGMRTSASMPPGRSLDAAISRVTGVSEAVLRDYRQCQHINTTEKLGWMKMRDTTREEDQSYCLLGIFDVTMTPQYGEGKDKARKRLLRKIHKANRSDSAEETAFGALSAMGDASAISRDPFPQTESQPGMNRSGIAGHRASSTQDMSSNRVSDDHAPSTAEPSQPASTFDRNVFSTMSISMHPSRSPSGPAEDTTGFKSGMTVSTRACGAVSIVAEPLGSALKIIANPTEQDDRYNYFLDGAGLAKYVLMRRLGFLAGANAEACRVSHEGRDGFVIRGSLPQEAQLQELRKQSKEHFREMRVDKHLSGVR